MGKISLSLLKLECQVFQSKVPVKVQGPKSERGDQNKSHNLN
jgi:hypothetical protein